MAGTSHKSGSASDGQRDGLAIEVAAVWLLFAVVSLEILVTYSMLPARELYHVSGTGLEGGASRALVFLNFPLALAALPILGLLFQRLPRRSLKALAGLAAVLCAAVFWPGVVSQANLDAKPVNAVAALGVLLTLLLTLDTARRHGLSRRPRQRGDRARILLATALLVLAAPWVAADLGFFLIGVPGLGSLFQTGTYRHQIAGLPAFPPAVHHGHHHGMDGFLLVVSALLLSRALGQVRTRGLRNALAGYIALMLCYGVGNIANDFWIEQVFKRGWTTWQIPDVLEPRLTVAWAIIVLAAATLWAVGARRARRPTAAVSSA